MAKVNKHGKDKLNHECPRCGKPSKIGVLLCEEHYFFTPSKHIIIHTCDTCGTQWREEYR